MCIRDRVTIATNMAGRGTDIMLGGNSEYLAKEEMRKLGYSEEQINQATARCVSETDVIVSGRALMEIYPKQDYHIFITADLEERVKRKCRCV